MSKNRSTWAALLSIVLAMVVMAGMAVTSFAETESLTPSGTLVEDPAALEAVLNGGELADGVNYDVDGNGIVEWADLDALNGTQVDLLPDGITNDWLGDADMSMVNFDSAIVRGDSTKSIVLNAVANDVSGVAGYALIMYTEPVDMSGWLELTFDTLWTNGKGTLTVTLYDSSFELANGYTATIEATEAGWSTNVIDLLDVPVAVKSDIWGIEFMWDEANDVYIDNLQTAFELNYVDVNYSSTYGSVESKQFVVGRPYGELPELAHTFYTFEGWYLDSGYTQKVTADTIVTAGAEHTLYAKWSSVTSDDGSVLVTDKGNGVFGVTLANDSYKQIRFNFKVKEMPQSGFSFTYVDTDDIEYTDPAIVIVDENHNAVRMSDVQADTWYTAIIYGSIEWYETNGTPWTTSASILRTGTLTVGEGIEMQVESLEAWTHQFGFRLYGAQVGWGRTHLDGFGRVYVLNQNQTVEWNSRIEVNGFRNYYKALTYDFYVNEEEGTDLSTISFTGSWKPTFYDDQGNTVAYSALQPKTWYRAVVDTTGWSGGTAYQYSHNLQYNAYMANINWIPADNQPLIDNVGAANTVTLTKNGTAGTFVAERISRDLSRVTYRVTDSASWTDRTLKVVLNDATKEFIQVDFRYLSAQANGAKAAPTMLVSTAFSGAPAAAKYIIVDENDDPVTSLETGKWYRLFITANSKDEFALVPMGETAAAAFELQLRNLNTYNADELDVKFNGMNLALSKFGKLEYVSTGSKTVTVDASGYKQIRFAVKGGTVTGTGVTTTGTGTWKTVVITNNGNDLGSLTLQLSGNVRIQNLKAYTTTEEPESNASTQFRGLDKDELMIAGFLGPREGYTAVDGTLLPSTIRDDIFVKIAQSGINYITDNNQAYNGSSLESSKEALRLAAKYGINYYMPAYDLVSIGVNGGTEAVTFLGVNREKIVYKSQIVDKAAIKERILEMYQYESFGGLYLRDEPHADLFDEILTANTMLAEIESEMGAGTVMNQYVNLFPDLGGTGGHSNFQYYNSPDGGKGGFSNAVLDWDNYLKAGILDTGMDYVSFDMYPFQADGEGNKTVSTTFLNYLGRVNKVATTAGVPWMGAAQVGGNGTLGTANEAEMNWDVNAMLAFGSKGVIYYIHVAPPYFNAESYEGGNKDCMININGETTEYYDYVQKINNQIQAIDHVLMNATHKGVILSGSGIMDYSESTGKTTLLNTTSELNTVKLSSVSGTALIGAFDYNGKTALLVVNNSVESASAITLNFTGSYTYEVIADAATSWQTGTTASLNLAAGRCALVLVHTSAVSTDIDLQFNLNYETGASAPAPITMTWSSGAKYPELPTVKRSGYIFGGWYLDAQCTGNPVAAGEALAVNGGHTLFAKWTPETVTDIVLTTSTTISAPIWRYNEADGWHWYITDNGNSLAADYRRAMVTLPEDGMHYLSYEVKFNSLSGNAKTVMGLTQGVNKYYDPETGELMGSGNGVNLELGKWYRVEYSTNNAANMGTSPWIFGYAGAFGEGNLSFSIRKMEASAVPFYGVNFNLNYEGAENAPAGFVVEQGATYGTLPVPAEREGLVFAGWYLNAAGTGNAVTEDTAITATHILYAKWIIPDDNPVVVRDNAAYNPNNAKLTHTAVNGKHVYTYTTRDVAAPTTSAYGRRVEFTGWAEGTKYVAIEFRYTEAFAADGVTPIQPSLGVYNGSSGVGSPKIFDATGKLIASGNAATGLTVGQWYTVVIEPGNYTSFAFWTAHNYTTDAAILTMEIRDRACTADPGLSQSAVKFETIWGDFADPMVDYMDGTWCYAIGGGTQSVTGEHRQLNVTLTDANINVIEFEFKMNSLNATTVSMPGGVAKTITNLDGTAVTEYQVDTWYKVTATNDAGFGTTRFIFGYLGAYEVGGLNCYIRNVRAAELNKYEVSFNLNYEGAENAPEAITVVEGGTYGTLPVPAERENYAFAGWYLDAACTGDAVTAATAVTTNHTLYAKWTLGADSNPVVVNDNATTNPYQAIITRDIVDGKNVYTYTTKGTVAPSNDPWARRLNISFPAGQAYVAIEFRYTEAFAADGVTAIENIGLGVYNGTSGVGYPRIFDENGNVVAAGNATSGLTVGQWYTLIVAPGNLSGFSLWPCHGYKTDAAVITMEVRDRACTADTGLAESDIKFETIWGDFADPLVNYMNGTWCYAIVGGAQSVSAEHRQLNVTLTPNNIKTIEFEFMMNGLNGTSVSMPGGKTKTFTNLDGSAASEMVAGTWYKVTATADTVFETTRFIFGYLGGYSTGGLNMYIRNVQLTELGNYEVTFDLNYEGAENAPEAITVEQGSAYGELPTPAARENYDFGGWYKNAACTGEAVTNATTVTEAHTLYAKWTLKADPNPVVVKDNATTNPNQAIITRDIVDGKHIYTYTTKGAVSPSNDPWARRLSFGGWAEGTKYVAIEFRYTEAFQADGVTPIEPSVGVYNGTSGVGSPKIFDVNGNVVASGNAKTGLTVGQWYTIVIEPGNYTGFDFWTAHNHTTDAPVLTIEVRERTCTADAALGQGSITFTTPWGIFADPVVAYVDGFWCYDINGGAQSMTAEQRQMSVTLTPSNIKTISFEFKANSLNGTATVGMVGGVAKTVTNLDGSAVGELQVDTWYKVTATSDSVFATTAFNFGHLGGWDAASGLNFFIRNVQLTELGNYEVSFDLNYQGAVDAPAAIEVAEGSAYGELPTPAARENYDFGGWYKNAACTGEAVTNTTTVTEAHTLYAKWTLKADPNPVVVKDNATTNPNNVIITRDIVEGEHIYTYTTKGVAAPTNSAWGRRLTFTGWAEGTKYVAIEFRYTEAFQADGVTSIQPSVGVYNGQSGVGSPKIFDINGNIVASGNATTGLTVGQWYTIVIEPGNYTSFDFWTAHNYTTDAAILTMEIRERACTADAALGQGSITFTTPWGDFADPVVSYVDGSWCYDINGGAQSTTAEHRQMSVTLTPSNIKTIEFEFMMNGLNGTSVSMPGGKAKTITNLDGSAVTEFQENTWYKVTATSDTTFETTQFVFGYLGGYEVGGLNCYIRNVQLAEVGNYEVSFDLNYEGAVDAPAAIEVAEGSAYGELPTPADREFFTFAGWYTDAACTGEAVTVETTVNAAHTLYAKWTMKADPNTVVVKDNASYNPNNAKTTCDIVDGKYLYTYTTRGVAAPTNSAFGRRVEFTGWAEGTKYVAIEFRYTEAYAADGVTEIQPSLGVYNGGSGVGSPKIFDTTGKLIAQGNATTGLTVGQWYTIVIEPGNYTSFAFWTAHNYTTDAAILTMEIRDRACTADPGLSQSAVKFETIWGDFADPMVDYMDGTWCYAIGGSHQSVAAEHRQLNVTLTPNNIKTIEFEFMMNGLNGTAVSLPGGKAKTVTNLDGSAASEMVVDTWYKVTATSDSVFETTRFIFAYVGGYNTGGLNMYIRNVQLTEAGKAEVSFNLNYEGAGEAPATVEVTEGTAYSTLPVPAERAGYVFDGWYTNADCTGEAVTAETKVTVSHTLYAKWSMAPDTNSVVVRDNAGTNPNQAIITCGIVEGKHVYTYTTKGAVSPSNDPWARRLDISFPASQAYVAVEFRYTEAFAADGVTPIEPSMGVYNGTSGVGSPKIFDATGKLIASGNAKTGLTVGEWYTIVVTPGSYTSFSFWTAHNYTADAPVLTIEIRERACTADTGLAESGIKFATIWGDFADPLVNYMNGTWCYAIGGSHQSVAAEHRQLNVTLTDADVTAIEFEFMINGLNGTAVSLPGGKTKNVTNLDGSAVSEMVVDTWYKVTATSDTAFETTQFIFAYLGGYNTGGLNMYIRNVQLTHSGS